MFGRIFGRGKDETDQAVCAQCGRTLLAGEWTQKVVDADGNEHLICSLCGQTQALGGAEPVAASPTPANNGRVRESRVDAPGSPPPAAAPPADVPDVPAPASEPRAQARDARSESDAFWRALKDKDAEIERLRAQLARNEAEKQELAGRLALAQGLAAPSSAGPAGDAGPAAVAVPPAATGPAIEAGPTVAVPPVAAEPAAAVPPVAAEPAAEVLPAQPLVPSAAGFAASAEPAPQPESPRPTGDASEPGERTWGETPAEFAAELAAVRDEEAALARETPPAWPSPAGPPPYAAPVGGPPPAGAVSEPPSAAEALVPVVAATQTRDDALAPQDVAAPVHTFPPGAPAVVFEDTQPIPAISDAQVAAAGVEGAAPYAAPPSEAETTLTPEPTPGFPATGVPASAPAAAAAPPAPREPTIAELEAEAASLTLLQRGVDLLNVSRVPHKIAETNEQLGLPSVHVGFDGRVTAVTFMWTMGWYRFQVDSASGEVHMADRGYEELVDLRPNASVRADGTVQLAPAQISRAAAQRPPAEPLAEAPAAHEIAGAPDHPEPPSVAAQKPPEILSKSLLGQRSDDEAASWEKTQARDFDWDR